MRKIESKVQAILETGGFKSLSVDEVATGKGRVEDSYEQLVDLVAETDTAIRSSLSYCAASTRIIRRVP